MLRPFVTRHWPLLVALVAVLATGCVFTVTFPAAMQTTSQDFSIDAMNRLVITVRFSEDIDMSSLVPQTNVVLVTEQDANAPITITAGSSADEIVITSVDQIGALLIFDSDGFFTLRIESSPLNIVRSASGGFLDGNADGSAGGAYETTFVLLG